VKALEYLCDGCIGETSKVTYAQVNVADRRRAQVTNAIEDGVFEFASRQTQILYDHDVSR
jgi:hypothetical protein